MRDDEPLAWEQATSPVSATPIPQPPILVVVTGIMAAGKSTVAHLLAAHFSRGVHVEADVLQHMIVAGGEWASDAGDPSGETARQLHLRLHNMCLLGKSFLEAGFSVILDDIILGDRWRELQVELAGVAFTLVVLAPNAEIVAGARDLGRVKSPRGREWAMYLDRELRATMPETGIWIDSSQQTPEETVAEILARIMPAMGHSTTVM